MKQAMLAIAVAVSVAIASCGTSSTGTSGTATSGSELTASEKACADNWETISHSEMLRMKRDRSIDGIYDWSGGYWVSYEKIMDIC